MTDTDGKTVATWTCAGRNGSVNTRMAVYTEVSDEELVTFSAEYDIGEALSLTGIAEGVENSNFLLNTGQGPYILTIYEKRVNPDELPFFFQLLEHLSAQGVPCPVPVAGRDGEVLRTLCGKPAAVVTFLAGMWPKRQRVEHCAELGRVLARMHMAAESFPRARPNDLSIEGWRPLLAKAADRADEVRPGLADILSHELDALEAAWPDDLPRGVIHADLFPDNVFFRGDEISGVIDFYFACTDAFAYDVAICMNAWCFEPDGSFNVTKAKRLLTAYKGVRGFSGTELAALPILARGAALRFVLTRLYDWLNTPGDALVTKKDPLEYLDKLRFHQGVKGPGEYGLA